MKQERAQHNARRVFYLLLLILAGYRLTLIDSGHFYWRDEMRYFHAEAMVDALAVGDYHTAAAEPFQCLGRPGFILLSAIPAFAQQAVGGFFGVDRDTLRYYDTVAIWNVLVSLGVTACLFQLGLIWLHNSWYALLIAAVYSLLCHANVWIRHLMPYNLALLAYLIAMILIITPTRDLRRVRWRTLSAGLLSALGHSIYPSYYGFLLVNAVVLLAMKRRRVPACGLFVVGGATTFWGLELLARFGGVSFIDDLALAVATQATTGPSHGYYAEGYSFVWHYLRDAEGAIGIALAALFIFFVVKFLFRSRAAVPPSMRAAILMVIACYLLHATMSVVFHKTVFFGRFLGVYLPFLVIGAVAGIALIQRAKLRALAIGTLGCFSIWSFASFAGQYSHIVYPADMFLQTLAQRRVDAHFPPAVLWGFAHGEADSVEEIDTRFSMVMDNRPEGTESPLFYLDTYDQAAARRADYIGVNFKWVFYYRQKDTRFQPPPGYKLVAQGTSPTAFPPTGFEAYKPWERRRLVDRKYQMRLFERVSPPTTKVAASTLGIE